MWHKGDKFVTRLIVNVNILIRLDENISKISFFYVNVSNILLDENVHNFSWRKLTVIFLPKCQYVSLNQNVNKLSILNENINNFILFKSKI